MDLLPKVGVVPMGDVMPIVPKVIAAHISGYFNLHAEVLERRPIPPASLDTGRLQYDVARILTVMEADSFVGFAKVVAVTNVDLFVPVFSYVIGESRLGGRCAAVSLFRLAEDPLASDPPEPKLLERAAKVALHELGHLFHLAHCSDRRCLMCLSGPADDLDRRSLSLCRYCHRFLQDSIRSLSR
jgi:archaemetzincin